MILTDIPSPITEIGLAGWTMTTIVDYTGSTNNDVAFVYAIDDVASTPDNEEYCAVMNNLIDTSLSVNVSDGETFDSDDDAYTALGNAFCYSTAATTGVPAADGLEIVFMKEAN